jgi:hypothetical protein
MEKLYGSGSRLLARSCERRLKIDIQDHWGRTIAGNRTMIFHNGGLDNKSDGTIQNFFESVPFSKTMDKNYICPSFVRHGIR